MKKVANKIKAKYKQIVLVIFGKKSCLLDTIDTPL